MLTHIVIGLFNIASCALKSEAMSNVEVSHNLDLTTTSHGHLMADS